MAVVGDKSALRRELRARRRALPGQIDRSAAIAERLLGAEVVAGAGRVLTFDAIPGEPDLSTLRAALLEQGAEVRVPEDDVDPGWPDVVIVPGVAFTVDGDRLGQGGGWYDRFLPRLRSDCVTIGVAFTEQIVEALPVEPHDVRVQRVVTDG